MTEYSYDNVGRLARVDDPAGGFQTLSREETANGYIATKTTALGRITRYQVENLLTSGQQKLTNTLPAGEKTELFTNHNGISTMVQPDGNSDNNCSGTRPSFRHASPSNSKLEC